MEDIKEVIERLSMKAITSKVEAKDYPNCIVLKKDLITLLNRLEQLEKENEKKRKRLDKQFKLLEKRDKEIEELKADNSHQWEERCKLTFAFEELGRDFEIIQHEHDRLDKRNNELIEENKRLEKENKELKDITQMYDSYCEPTLTEKPIFITNPEYFACGWFKENRIPKSRIRAKIEELEKLKGEYDDTPRLYTAYDSFDFQINILKELLGEEK